ncbi:metallo-dependent hydrolase [Klebsiella michiganensis]|uniref:Metallo-dependent hydrolase n=1 Tax=Klebsiella michiganensis TaxID=1134687 RepID=A0A7H4PQP0_9ENTR|nr:metallo-dependent hydrolase [Klebsiella michiganensis]
MFDLLLRRARLVDDTLTDIAIRDGKIAALGEISAPARKTLELDGRYYVSAGWIDSHVHCYPNSPIYHDEPDSVGVATGVTTVIDAGSTGADDVDDFYQLTRKAATEVYALLNISRVGLIAQNELANMANIDAGGGEAGGQSLPELYRRPEGADEQQRGGGKRHYAAGARKGDSAGKRRPAADGAYRQQSARPG